MFYIIMKAVELRMGNLIDEFGISRRVLPQDILSLYQIEIANKICINLTPIPLTEEWLIKFGFVFDYDCYHNNIALYLSNEGFNYDVNFFEHSNLHNIKYVHQLQNLYHALTGEELTLK